MKMAYARKFTLHVLITAFNLFFPSAPLICKYNTKLWCQIIDLISIFYFVYICYYYRKMQNTWKKKKRLIIVHQKNEKRQEKRKNQYWKKELVLWVSYWQVSFLDSQNVSIRSLESNSLLCICLLCNQKIILTLRFVILSDLLWTILQYI